MVCLLLLYGYNNNNGTLLENWHHVHLNEATPNNCITVVGGNKHLFAPYFADFLIIWSKLVIHLDGNLAIDNPAFQKAFQKSH